MAERITPILAPAREGARALRGMGVSAQLIFIDASHEYEDVYDDLRAYAGLLAPGGVIVGDDLRNFPGVLPAAVRFSYEAGMAITEIENMFVLKGRENAG